jgi:hypothetical protein
MKYPELKSWQRTSTALQQTAMLVGAIQNALFAPRRNYLQLSAHVQPHGLVSPRLPGGGRVAVDFAAGTLEYDRPGGDRVSLDIVEHTQATLFEALLGEMKEDAFAQVLADAEAGSFATRLIQAHNADDGKVVSLSPDDLQRTDSLRYDRDEGRDYAAVLDAVYTGVARFRAHLEGHMTPVVVWPEHFDLSTLWFHPDNADMDETQAHINFGFAPFSEGFERPYLYVYLYPYPDGFTPPALPAPAVWNTEGFRGIVVRHDDLAKQKEVVPFVENLYLELFHMLGPLLGTKSSKGTG